MATRENVQNFMSEAGLRTAFFSINMIRKSDMALNVIPGFDFEIASHPFYLLDLAPSDFYLFPKLKNNLSDTMTLTMTSLMRWNDISKTKTPPSTKKRAETPEPRDKVSKHKREQC